MSLSDPSPPAMMPPQHFGDSAAYMSLPLSNDQFDSESLFNHLKPHLKRSQNFDGNPSSTAPYLWPNPSANTGTTDIFFKTRLCAKFKMGTCRNGGDCNFAIGIEDTRQPPPNWQEPVGAREDDL